MKKTSFHSDLYEKIDRYVHETYRLVKKFPKEELFGSSSQLKRSALSVMLNYVEGFARNRQKVNKNFIEISYGSLRESKYLFNFAFKEGFLSEHDYQEVDRLAEEIGAMLWGIIKKI